VMDDDVTAEGCEEGIVVKPWGLLAAKPGKLVMELWKPSRPKAVPCGGNRIALRLQR